MPYESTKIHNSIWRKRLEIRILSLNPQIIEELVRPVVHNQLVREKQWMATFASAWSTSISIC